MKTEHRRSRRSWWDGRHRSSPWSSGALALSATISLFAAAFVAMTTVRGRLPQPESRQSAPAVVVLTPPAKPREQPRPRAQMPTPPPSSPIVVVPPNPAPAAPVDARSVQPRTEPDTTRRDPGRPAAGIPLIPTVPLRDYRPFPGDSGKTSGSGSRGSVGVTAHSGNISAAQRDSLTAALMMQVPKLAQSRKATAEEMDALRRQREPGLDPRGRAARLPGEPVYAPTMGGNVAIGIPVISFALPDGRNRARDSAVHADNMARLRRLQDLALWRRDSIRADSLRRDSLARERITPRP